MQCVCVSFGRRSFAEYTDLSVFAVRKVHLTPAAWAILLTSWLKPSINGMLALTIFSAFSSSTAVKKTWKSPGSNYMNRKCWGQPFWTFLESFSCTTSHVVFNLFHTVSQKSHLLSHSLSLSLSLSLSGLLDAYRLFAGPLHVHWHLVDCNPSTTALYCSGCVTANTQTGQNTVTVTVVHTDTGRVRGT